jgi:HAD superfamily phosphoserine phosphatase-like hydrolase
MKLQKDVPPPHFAVFDFDKSLINNDCTEALLAYLARKRYAGAEYDFNHYHSLLDAHDTQEAYRFAARAIAGFTIRGLNGLVHATMVHEDLVLTNQNVLGRTIPRGISLREDVVALLRGLQDRGIDVWVVSASPELVVRSTMEYFGIKAKLIGVRNVLDGGVVTPELTEPLSIYEGKVACIQQYIHPTARPLAGLGDSMGDLSMLTYSLLPIVAARNNDLAKKAEVNGWHLL